MVGYQLNNVGGMVVLENHHFADILTIRQETSVRAKTSRWEFVEDHDIYSLKTIFARIAL